MKHTNTTHADTKELLQCAELCWCILDEHDSIIECSEEFAQLFHQTRSHTKKTSFAQYVHSGDHGHLRDAVKRSKKRRAAHTTLRCLQGKQTMECKATLRWSHARKRQYVVLEPTTTHSANQDGTLTNRALQVINECIVITNAEGIIQYCNRAWEECTGQTPHTIVGSSIHESFNLQERTQERRSLEHALEQKEPVFLQQMPVHCHRESSSLMNFILYPTKHHGEYFFIGVLQEMSSDELLDKERYEFSSLSSHQLRTPLSAIRWIINMFESGKTGPMSALQKELIADAKKCIQQMSYTIRSLFMITQIENNQLNVTNEAVALHDVIKHLRAKNEEELQKKQQHLSLYCSKNITLETDAKILGEALNHLLENAIKYTPENGTISVRARHTKDGISINIKDTGYGIPKSEYDHVFRKFYRGSNIVKRETDGNGLGLYLTKSLATALGGNISFSSKEQEGTTFTIIMPEQ